MFTKEKEDALKAFNELLNQEPPFSEESEADDQGKTYKHIPIAQLEEDLAFVYNGLIQHTKVKVKQLFGFITTTMNLKVFHPVIETWLNYGGVAAVKIESEEPGEYRGSTKMLVADDLKTGIALCYSEAIKNAAKKIPGKRFGSDLNRPPKTIKSAFDEIPFDINSIKNKRDLIKAKASGRVTQTQFEIIEDCLKNKIPFPEELEWRDGNGLAIEEGVIETVEQVKQAVEKIKTKKGKQS